MWLSQTVNWQSLSESLSREVEGAAILFFAGVGSLSPACYMLKLEEFVLLTIIVASKKGGAILTRREDRPAWQMFLPASEPTCSIARH